MVILPDKHHRARVKIACLDMYLCQKDQHIVVHALQAHTVQMQRQYYGVQQESITMKLGKHQFHHVKNVHLENLATLIESIASQIVATQAIDLLIRSKRKRMEDAIHIYQMQMIVSMQQYH